MNPDLAAQGWAYDRRMSWRIDVEGRPDLFEYRDHRGRTGRTLRPRLAVVEVIDRGGAAQSYRSAWLIVSGRVVRRDGTLGVQSARNTYNVTRLASYSADVLPDWLRELVTPVVADLVTRMVDDVHAAAADVVRAAVPVVTGGGADVFEVPRGPVDALAEARARTGGRRDG